MAIVLNNSIIFLFEFTVFTFNINFFFIFYFIVRKTQFIKHIINEQNDKYPYFIY